MNGERNMISTKGYVQIALLRKGDVAKNAGIKIAIIQPH